MTCRYFAGAIVCGSPVGVVRRKYLDCPVCERRTRFVIRFGGAWYGSTGTCCRCGDSWQDGEQGERPFARGWRKEAIAIAQQEWVEAMTPREYEAAVRRDIEWAMGS